MLLHDFAGGRHRIMEYLDQEVFSHQPAHIQEFLLSTSVVDRFSAALAADLLDTGTIGCAGASPAGLSAEALTYLERENLFLVSLDEQRKWYRYHQLFQGLLQERLLARAGSARVAQLQQRASRWFESQGLLNEAFYHALAAEATLAADFVEEHTHDLLNQDDFKTLESWIARLPQELVQERPRLLLAQVYLCHISGRYAAMPPLLDRAEQRLDKGSAQSAPVVEAEIRAGIAGMRSAASYFGVLKPDYMLSQAEQALTILANLPRRCLWYQGIVTIFWAGAQQILGRGAEVIESLQTLLENHSGPPNAYTLRLWMTLCFLYQIDDDIPRLAEAAAAMLYDATQSRQTLSIGWAHFFLGFAAYERNDLEDALAHFQTASELRYYAHYFVRRDSMLGQACVWLARNQTEGARRSIEATLGYVQETRTLQSLGFVRGMQARVALATGDFFPVYELAVPRPYTFDYRSSTFLELPGYTYARLLLAEGTAESLQQADELLGAIVEGASRHHHLRQMISALALGALVHKAQDRMDEALDALDQALCLARPRGLIRTFVDLGQEMGDLLRQLQPHSAYQTYIAALQAALRPDAIGVQSVTKAPIASELLVEPLTARELDVFELLARRRSYGEIAAQLVISPNTVKKHVTNIYGKLGVERRSQAIAKAYQLGLLPFTEG